MTKIVVPADQLGVVKKIFRERVRIETFSGKKVVADRPQEVERGHIVFLTELLPVVADQWSAEVVNYFQWVKKPIYLEKVQVVILLGDKTLYLHRIGSRFQGFELLPSGRILLSFDSSCCLERHTGGNWQKVSWKENGEKYQTLLQDGDQIRLEKEDGSYLYGFVWIGETPQGVFIFPEIK